MLPVPIDFETTGLDIRSDVALQFGMLLVDRDFEIIADFGSRVMHATDQQLDGMSEFVTNMHAETGLLEEVRASTLAIDEVDREAVAWLAEHGVADPRSGVILGSSCRLDLNFIDRDMPLLAERLTYRMIDVSGFELALEFYEPEMIPGQPFEIAEQDDFVQHRTSSDIRWSLEMARKQRAQQRAANKAYWPA